jgi:hypothetical protein
MELQFNRRHGAVVRNFDVGEPVCARYRQSHEWKAASVAKRIGGRLYYVTLSDGWTRRFHANHTRPRYTQLTEDDFTEFASAFKLPVRRSQAASGETGPVDEHAETTTQETPTVDNGKSEQPSNESLEPRRSKRGHIPKKRFELDPIKKTNQYP